MATTVTITDSYAGEVGKWTQAAILTANTLANNLIDIQPNVKYKHILRKLSTSGILNDYACDFSATGSITATEKSIEPKKLKLNKKLCKDSFRDSWEAIQMGYSAHDVLPKTFEDFLLAQYVSKVALAIENSIWNGDSANDGEFTGVFTQLTTDANLPAANEVGGTTLTAANIIAELTKVANAITTAMYSQGNVNIYVSQNAYRLYMQALGGFGASGLGANGYNNQGVNQAFNSLMFTGIPVVPVNGFTANQMLATYKENIVFCTGLMNDYNDVRVIDQSPLDGSDNVHIVMKMTAGVGYIDPADIVTYGITNNAN